jgi:ACS family tartrate transporter-like MFS transporter
MMPRVWRNGVVYFCILVGLYGFSFWLPQIIASLGEMSNLQVGLFTMIPYTLACIGLVLWGRHSDATEERSWHVALPSLLGAAALMVSGWSSAPLIGFVALCLAAVGIYSGLPAFWALASRGLQGVAAAGAIALVNSIGNLGGFLGPAAIGAAKAHTGSYATSLLVIAAFLVLGAVLVIWERAQEQRAVSTLKQA